MVEQRQNMWMNCKMDKIKYFNTVLIEGTEDYNKFQNGDL